MLEFTIDRDDISLALALLKPAIGRIRYSSYAPTSCVHFYTGPCGALYAAASDLETYARINLPVCSPTQGLASTGGLGAPHKALSEWIRSQPRHGAALRFAQATPNTIKAEGFATSATFVGWPAEDMPAAKDLPPSFYARREYHVSPETLSLALSGCLPCVARNDPARTLSGILVTNDPEGLAYANANALAFVATDRYRLARYLAPSLDTSLVYNDTGIHDTEPFSAIVPGPLATAASKALAKLKPGEHDHPPVLAFGRAEDGASWVAISIHRGPASVTYKSRAIVGDYPNWRRVWPSRQGHTIGIDPFDLRNAVSSVAPAATANGNKITLCPDGHGHLHIFHASAVGETTSAMITADYFPVGDEPIISVNARYLLAALKSIPGGVTHITFDYGHSEAPLRWQTDLGLSGIIMPMGLDSQSKDLARRIVDETTAGMSWNALSPS